MRGQTTLDFVIGISVFLAVILFTFLFVPGILTPFTATGQSDAVTVDRTADYLAQDALASPERPTLLDRSCTVAFFDRDGDDSPPGTFADECGYADDTLTEQLGVAQRRIVNVTITGNVSGGIEPTQLYWDSNERELTADATDGDIALRIGPSPEHRRETTTATRTVTLHDHDVTLTVVVS